MKALWNTLQPQKHIQQKALLFYWHCCFFVIMTLIHLWINYAAQRSGRPEDVPLFMVFFVLSIPFGFFAFLSNFLARRAYASAVKEKPGFEKFYNK